MLKARSFGKSEASSWLYEPRPAATARTLSNEALETLAEARLLHEARAYRGAVNRAYYAMFYALSSLLALHGLSASKHSGAIALFDREFVRSGRFAPEHSRALHTAFQHRQVSDYQEMTYPDAELSQQNIEAAQQFVSAVQRYLAEQDSV